MKTIKSLLLIFSLIAFISATSFAASSTKTAATHTIKIFAPVYKTVTDSDITYYRTKINGEDILVDNKGRFIKYLCDEEEEMQTHMPVTYKAIMVPVNLLLKVR